MDKPTPDFEQLISRLEEVELTTVMGRITEVVGMLIKAVVPQVRIGEVCLADGGPCKYNWQQSPIPVRAAGRIRGHDDLCYRHQRVRVRGIEQLRLRKLARDTGDPAALKTGEDVAQEQELGGRSLDVDHREQLGNYLRYFRPRADDAGDPTDHSVVACLLDLVGHDRL